MPDSHEKPKEPGDIKETDIIFDCPYCSKSLAIDYRGAGLTIKCSDCGSDVQVPIPEGMELNDIDSSDEEQEIRIMHLRRSLASAETRIKRLESALEETSSHRESLEKTKADTVYRQKEVLGKLTEIQQSLKDAADALGAVAAVLKGESAT